MKKICLFFIALFPVFAWSQPTFNFGSANTANTETNGSAVAPIITVDASSLVLFHTTSGTASAPQTIFVSASGLTSDLTISPVQYPPELPSFEFSVDGGITYSKTTDLKISPVDGVISNAPVTIRVAAEANWDYYVEDFIFSAVGATSQQIRVEADIQGVGPAVVTVDASGITPFAAIFPAVSATQNVTISGTGVNGIVIFPYGPFEISKDGGTTWVNNAGPTSNAVGLLASGDIVTPTSILVRLMANTAPGTANGGLFIDASAAHNHIINLTGLITAASALPVKIESFAAVKEDNTVNLAWKSSEEINSVNYAVQRSSDGNNFTTIGDVAAKGVAASYIFTDANPLTGDNYYRLKPVDKDGKFTYSKVVKVNFTKLPAIHISPNPASSYLYISLENISQPVNLQLLNTNGQVVKQTIITQNLANKSISLVGLPKGLYSVKLVSQQKVTTQKLVIQ